MRKRLVQDVVLKTRSIRDIPLPENRCAEKDDKEKPPQHSHKKRRGGFLPKRPKVLIWGIAALAIFALVFSAANAFERGRVTIVAKKTLTSLDAVYTVYKDASVGNLSYTTIALNREISGDVAPTGEKKGEERAKGRVIIYNAFSKESQRLVKNTRLETPAGLIFKIEESVVIPGLSTKDGKNVPGSVEVTAYAESPGPEYNVGLSDFTIPGFKSDKARYEGFYARSKTKMAGGFSGLVKTLSEEKVQETRMALREKLREELYKEVLAQTPEEFVLFTNAPHFQFESEDPLYNGAIFTLTEKASVTVPIFKREEIARVIGVSTVVLYDGWPLVIKNMEDLVYEVKTKGNVFQEVSFQFSLKGAPEIEWLVDEEKLKEDLAGKPKDELPAVMVEHKGIESAQASMWPLWKRSFPDNPQKIHISRDIEE